MDFLWRRHIDLAFRYICMHEIYIISIHDISIDQILFKLASFNIGFVLLLRSFSDRTVVLFIIYIDIYRTLLYWNSVSFLIVNFFPNIYNTRIRIGWLRFAEAKARWLFLLF